jgi:hypothetical protein
MYWRLTTSSPKLKGAKTSTRTYSYFIATVTIRKLLTIPNDNGKISREVLIRLVFVDEERCESKGSRTVLEPSQ